MIVNRNWAGDPGFSCYVSITSSNGVEQHINDLKDNHYVSLQAQGTPPFTVDFEPEGGSFTITVQNVNQDALVGLGADRELHVSNPQV